MTDYPLSTFCVAADSTVRQVMACINSSDVQIALVVDEESRLLDTITDGDIRRAILAGIDLDSQVGVLRKRRVGSLFPEPITAPLGTDRSALLRLMQQRGVRQMPLLDQTQRVVGLVTFRDLMVGDLLPLRAVIMAGGYGHRLRPLTDDLPKPMLPIGNKPLLELIVNQLRDAGVREINVTTHYRSESISEHFKDGRDFGVEIRYLHEEKPLGTAGALSLLEKSDDVLLVINGDILTRIDFRAMLDFHSEHKADMTIGVRPHEVRIPYGVIESDGVVITGITEKPVVQRFINAGIYMLHPSVPEHIPAQKPYDMTDLTTALLSNSQRVVGFPVHEYWLDIGHIEDYRKAVAEMESSGDA